MRVRPFPSPLFFSPPPFYDVPGGCSGDDVYLLSTPPSLSSFFPRVSFPLLSLHFLFLLLFLGVQSPSTFVFLSFSRKNQRKILNCYLKEKKRKKKTLILRVCVERDYYGDPSFLDSRLLHLKLWCFPPFLLRELFFLWDFLRHILVEDRIWSRNKKQKKRMRQFFKD